MLQREQDPSAPKWPFLFSLSAVYNFFKSTIWCCLLKIWDDHILEASGSFFCYHSIGLQVEIPRRILSGRHGLANGLWLQFDCISRNNRNAPVSWFSSQNFINNCRERRSHRWNTICIFSNFWIVFSSSKRGKIYVCRFVFKKIWPTLVLYEQPST